MQKFMCTWLWVAALAAAPVYAVDHPIIISGGSPLVVQHDEWVGGGDDHSLATKQDNATVTSVEVKLGSEAPRIIPFNKQRCEISLRYGTIGLNVSTNANGQVLRIRTDGATFFSKRFRRRDKGTYESLVSDQHIDRVRILKAGADQGIPAYSGHVELVIHYQD
jgi:hypothetical protein